MNTDNALLAAESVGLSYDQQPVVENCSFHLNNAECMALLGRSGSGKTTLLHACAGLLPVQSGILRIAGHALHKLNDAQRTAFRRHHVGVIFQQFNLVPTLTVMENLQLVLAINKQNIHTEYAAGLLDALAIAHKADDFPAQLSGGEQQRVAVARALVHQPDLILADEPTGNLDIDTARQVMQLLISTCKRTETALILVTHSTELPDGLDRVTRLLGGRLHYE